jgi:hypothetical protein
MRYHKQVDGEWVRPILKGYRIRCCDCGLVHHIDFRLRGRHVEFRATRARGRNTLRAALKKIANTSYEDHAVSIAEAALERGR